MHKNKKKQIIEIILRCTFALFSKNLPAGFGAEGKWVKFDCQRANSFVCKFVDGHVVVKCRGSDWEAMNDDKCIKVKKESKPFDLAVKPESITVNLFLYAPKFGLL